MEVTTKPTGSTWEFSTDAGANWSAGTGTSFSVTKDGTKSVTVRQTDAAGNTSSASTVLAFTLDTSAPTADLAGSTPVNHASNIALADSVTLRLTEALNAATDLSKLYLRDVATGTLVASDNTLSASGEQIVIKPKVGLNFSTSYNFTTLEAPLPEPEPIPVKAPVAPTPSTGPDTDGVPDAQENAIPGLVSATPGVLAVVGDGNGDGQVDSQQSNVTAVAFLKSPTAVTNTNGLAPVFVSLAADSKEGKVDTADNNSATLSNVKQLDAPANLPAEISMPLGLISFSSSVGLSDVVDASSGVRSGVVWNIDAQGSVSNIDPSAACNYSGSIKPNTNPVAVLDVSVTENCAGTQKMLTGIATLNAAKTSLSLAYTTDNGTQGGLVVLTR